MSRVQVVKLGCVFLKVPGPIISTIATQAGYAGSVSAVLKSFGYNADGLSGLKVHSLSNVMTMERNMHNRFDRLQLWFEPTVNITMVSWLVAF